LNNVHIENGLWQIEFNLVEASEAWRVTAYILGSPPLDKHWGASHRRDGD